MLTPITFDGWFLELFLNVGMKFLTLYRRVALLRGFVLLVSTFLNDDAIGSRDQGKWPLLRGWPCIHRGGYYEGFHCRLNIVY